jgi:hypothetical protein
LVRVGISTKNVSTGKRLSGGGEYRNLSTRPSEDTALTLKNDCFLRSGGSKLFLQNLVFAWVTGSEYYSKNGREAAAEIQSEVHTHGSFWETEERSLQR